MRLASRLQPRRFIILTLELLAASHAVAQTACPDPGASLQLILQRESVFWTPETFAGQILEPEIVVEPEVFEIYVGVVSQLPAEGRGIYGWNIFAEVKGDLLLLEADIAGTVAASVRDSPPGLVQNGIGAAKVFDRAPYGRFALASVTFSFDGTIALDPVGTATAVRLRIYAQDGAAGTVRVLQELEDAADGAGASLLPCCSEAGVGGEVLEFACAQSVDVRVVDTSGGCATPPHDAGEPIHVAWERLHDFYPATSGGTSIAKAGDGGTVITGWHSASSGYVLKVGASGEVAWKTFIEREGSLDLFAVTATSDGGYVLTGEAASFEQQLSLVKLRGDGAVEWDRLFGLPARPESGRAVVQTRDDGFAMAGKTYDTVYLVRTDGDGELLFDRELGAGAGSAICEDRASGALVIAGERGDDAIILKTDAGGEPIWEHKLSPAAPYVVARLRDVLVTREGDYLAVGSFRSARSPEFFNHAAILIAAVRPDGTLLEERILEPGPWAREAHSIATTPNGGYLVLGLSKLLNPAEFFLVRLDSGRKLLWQAGAGERTLYATDADVVVLGDGSAVATGTSTTAYRPWMARIDPVETGQLPSDLNQDGQLDLSDGVCLLGFLFGTEGRHFRLPCGDGTSANPANLRLGDGNQDGRIDISDAVSIFTHLFLGFRPPALGKECIAMEGCPGVCAP